LYDNLNKSQKVYYYIKLTEGYTRDMIINEIISASQWKKDYKKIFMKTDELSIDKYRNEDDTYTDENECTHDSAVDFYQCHVFDFCGCGCPEKNLALIRDGLQYIKNGAYDETDPDWYKKWQKKGWNIFGNEQSRYFFFYWADKEGLTEHGGSVPGWLTDKGQEALEDLTIILKDYEI